MKRKYEEHNEKVQMTIPSENLLVWNLKDGWEPLCKFLNQVRLAPLRTVTSTKLSLAHTWYGYTKRKRHGGSEMGRRQPLFTRSFRSIWILVHANIFDFLCYYISCHLSATNIMKLPNICQFLTDLTFIQPWFR